MKKVFFILCLCTISVYAHSLKVFLTHEGDKLSVYSYFTKSSPCQSCNIEIQTLDGEVFDKGVTDERGKASFDLKQQYFKVIVEASIGHRGEVEYSLEHPIKEQSDSMQLLKALVGFLGIGFFFSLVYFMKRKKD